MTLKAVVVGCGRMGSTYDDGRRGEPRSHAGTYRASDAVDLAGGVDPDPRRRDAFERRWRVPAFGTIEEAADRLHPDVWSICTPPEIRVDVIGAVVARGARAIWCEKPLAESVSSALKVERLVDRAGVPLVLNYSRRWDSGHRAVVAWMRKGRFGSLEHGVVHYTRGLRNYGTHAIDLLRWFVGEAVWVRAVPGYDDGSPDPSPCALLGYPGGAGVALMPVRRAAYNVFEVDLLGDRGRVTLSDFGRRVTVNEVVPMSGWPNERTLGRAASTPRIVAGTDGTLSAALRDVVSAARRGRAPSCGVRDGVAALRVAEAIDEAARTGRTVRVEGKAR